ncbi:XRE family transcriptional regulator [Amphritea sp. 2_MG-2023]|jgi:transcriptional regulator with XRE-family HTH domain|uniref:helix-turn-helix domain-containing protein n=1 Tax=Amphritea TaxID=515417 RepID=UPI001C06D73C|nr:MULTISPECIES: XRE family transcriptional regulator [Amphritea]MBU2965106.1 XRE family transcriptional regulator [Amphritea atlantica]MDO6418891.1 XRE family transcriptional regulator [Amphritea sp. 2_MG-2023]MDX2423249.1 XRE family transcriptional regulator [Amphritea sp.]
MSKNRKEAADQENLRIGRQIRDLRKAKNITLIDMAERIQRSVGYVSQVERGVSSLPIPVLQAISDVLGVQISWFFHSDREVPLDELNHIVRKDSRRSLNLSESGIREELLSPQLSGQLKMILTTFAPGIKNREPRKMKGEEGGVVQSGTLSLWIENNHFILNAGDSFTLYGDENYRVGNASETEETVVVWTIIGGY